MRLRYAQRTLDTIGVTPIATEAGNVQLVYGRVVVDQPLRSPLQDRPCAYYFFRVVEPRPSKLRKLATGKKWSPFLVQDPSGTALVDPIPAVVASPRRHRQEFKGLQRIPPGLERFFEEAGIDQKHLPRLPEFYVDEYTIEPDDQVYVT